MNRGSMLQLGTPEQILSPAGRSLRCPLCWRIEFCSTEWSPRSGQRESVVNTTDGVMLQASAAGSFPKVSR